MTTLKITAKGQVTLRQDILRHLGVRPGEQIHVEKRPDGRIEVRAKPPTGNIADIFNLLKRPGAPSLSIDEINAVTAKAWAAKTWAGKSAPRKP